MIDRREPLADIKSRRDGALSTLVGGVPYLRWLNIRFDRRGDELTAVLPYDNKLIGNPVLPALHGGATAAFLETSAIIELAWFDMWDDLEAGRLANSSEQILARRMPKTSNLTVNYLRSGLPRDAYARAKVIRSGRRYATVRVEAWQDNRSRLFAEAVGNFVMPNRPPEG